MSKGPTYLATLAATDTGAMSGAILYPGQVVADLQGEWEGLSVAAFAEMPYRHASWSKNRTWRHDRGHTHLATDAAKARDALAVLLIQALGRRRLVRNRAWVWLHIWLADHRGDAHNATALVLDAVKIATRLDDRWFCLGPVTWSIDAKNPRMAVWIGQADLPDLPAPEARTGKRAARRGKPGDSLGRLTPLNRSCRKLDCSPL